jgi:RNA polymerase sigma factor (sigma-70 family)
MVLRVCRRLLHNWHDAEDTCQATFLVLALKAGSPGWQNSIASWLHRVAYHVALKARAAAGRRAKLESRIDAKAEADPLAAITGRELRAVLDHELARLPEKFRAPIILCYLEGATRDEAALSLGCPLGTLKNRVERGRELLRRRLTKRGLELTSVLSAAALAENSATAGISIGLWDRVARASFSFKGYETASTGAGSGQALRMANAAMNSMLLTKIKIAAALFLTASALVAGVAGVAHPAWTSRKHVVDASQGPSQNIGPERQSNAAGGRLLSTDRFGDPLPAGAVARLGTTRLRHGGLTPAVQFTPDGKSLITMGADGLRVWDAATGKSLYRLANQQSPRLGNGILSADCKQVVSVEMMNKPLLRLWELATGKLVREFGDHFCVAGCFSPNSKVLATVGTSQPGDLRSRDFVNTISLWDLTNGKQLKRWTGHQGGVYSCLFSADGKTLITGGGDKTIRFWEVATGRQVRQFTGTKKAIAQLVFSPDGRLLAGIGLKEDYRGGSLFPSGLAWSADNSVSVWDVASGKQVQWLTVPRVELQGLSGITFAGFTPDSKSLVTGGPDHFARTWDLATGKELRRYDFGGNLWTFALSPDGKTLAGLPGGTTVRIIDTASGAERMLPAGHRGEITRILLTPDNKTAITAAVGESAIVLWNRATGQERQRLEGHESVVAGLVISGDGRTLYSAGYMDARIIVWDLSTGKLLRYLRKPPALGNGRTILVLTPDGKTLALTSEVGKTVFLVDTMTGNETLQFKEHGSVSHIAFTLDGLAVAVVSADLAVRLWNRNKGIQVREMAPPATNRVTGGVRVAGRQAFALSPDCKLLASVKTNGSPALLELPTRRFVPSDPKAGPGVSAFAFSPDQRMLAWSGWHDPIIRIMETATGKERQRFVGHQGRVSSLAFSADGRILASGSLDTTVLLWDMSEASR